MDKLKGDRQDGKGLLSWQIGWGYGKVLVVSELSEGLEWLRKGNLKSDHILDFLGIEEELADVIIRIMNMGKSKGWKIAEAVIEKLKYNENRLYKHGGKRF